MKRDVGNQNGFAVVYGIVVLFLASVTGFSLLYISQKDKGASADYSKMRTAAVASKAGLTAFERQCSNAPEQILDLVKKYTQDHNSKWLFGSVANSTEEQKISFWAGSDAPSFSARIMKFDPLSHLVQIEANGYGGSGGRKKTIGIYRLNGIDYVQASRYAIYLGGEGRFFGVPVIINGDVYFNGNFHFNGGASGSVIHGHLITGTDNIESGLDGNFEVDSNAYIRTPLKLNATLKVKGKTGLENNVYIERQMLLYNTLYMNNSQLSGNSNINMGGNSVYYSGTSPVAKLTNYSSVTNTVTDIDISSKLGFQNVSVSPITVDISSIPAGCIVNYPSIINVTKNDWNLTTLYNNQKAAGKLFNGFLVVSVNGGMDINVSGATYNGKVIWIIRSTVNCNGNWYRSGDQSNTLVYVTNGGYVQGLGSGNKFRGYIYVTGTGKALYSWKAGNQIYGAIHHVANSNNDAFQLNSMNGAAININFDIDVMKEFQMAGILKTPGDGGWPGSLVISDTKIRPELLSIYY